MKKFHSLIILIAILTSCREDNSAFTDKEVEAPTGTFWTYVSTDGLDVTQTLTGKKVTRNGRSYSEVSNLYVGDPEPILSYTYAENHVFSYIRPELVTGYDIELEYLHDDLAVGGTWQGHINATDTQNGVPIKVDGKIIEKNLTKVVQGKTYTKVTHTRLVLQANYLNHGFQDSEIYDYYVAQDVGIIEIDTKMYHIDGSLLDSFETQLVAYLIK